MRRRLGMSEWTATANPWAPDDPPAGGTGTPQGDPPASAAPAATATVTVPTAPATEWKPPASQADLDRIITERLTREVRSKYAGVTPEQIADYKAKAEQFDTLAAASRTDQERAIDETRKATEEATRAAERATLGPQLVALSFRAYGRDVPEPVLNGFLQDVNHGKYLNDDGTVNEDAVKTRVADLTVKPDARFPDLGQGQRSALKTTGVDAGRERYENRRRKT